MDQDRAQGHPAGGADRAAAAYSAFASAPGGLLIMSDLQCRIFRGGWAARASAKKGGAVAISHRSALVASLALAAALSLAPPAGADETPKRGGTLTYLV